MEVYLYTTVSLTCLIASQVALLGVCGYLYYIYKLCT